MVSAEIVFLRYRQLFSNHSVLLNYISLKGNVHHKVGSRLIVRAPHSVPWRHDLNHQIVPSVVMPAIVFGRWSLSNGFYVLMVLVSDFSPRVFCHLNKGSVGCINKTEARWFIPWQSQ